MKDKTTGNIGEPGIDVSGLRRSATDRSLDRDDLDADPFRQFEAWFESACQLDRNDPNAMSLSTVDEQGRPYARTVLLKSFDERGFVFYTNYESRKARHIEANPEAALLFFWSELGQQVGVRGAIEKLSTAESLRYFASRPRGSQLGAWVSRQSSVITSRSLLKNKVEELRRKFENREVPLPSFWGGYRLAPREIEFWQGREDRLHDRFLYTREGSDWHIARLAP
jgi:pyridoxamine 5'-phosphate oxidase